MWTMCGKGVCVHACQHVYVCEHFLGFPLASYVEQTRVVLCVCVCIHTYVCLHLLCMRIYGGAYLFKSQTGGDGILYPYIT